MAWEGLVGVAIGGVIGGIGQIIHSQYERFHQMKNLAAAFDGEIHAILDLLQTRQVENFLEASVRSIREHPGKPTSMSDILYLTIEQDYFTVYNTNTANIGILGTEAQSVARFYTLAKGLLDINAHLKPTRDILWEGSKTLTGNRDWLADYYTHYLAEYRKFVTQGEQAELSLNRIMGSCFCKYLVYS